MIENFGKNVARIRKEQGLTQKELAEKLEINKQTVSNIEKGTAYPSFTVLDKISKVLDANPIQLFGTAKEIAIADTPVILSEIDKHDQQIKNLLKAEKVVAEINSNNVFRSTIEAAYFIDEFVNGQKLYNDYGEPVIKEDGEIVRGKSTFGELPFKEINDIYEKLQYIAKNKDDV